MDQACRFECGETRGTAGKSCEVACDWEFGSFFPVEETSVTCTSRVAAPLAGDGPSVDECSFAVTVVPVTEVCAGTFSGTYLTGGLSGSVLGPLFSDATISIAFVDPIDETDVTTKGQEGWVSWERMRRLIEHCLHPARICHPYPLRRMDVIT